MKDFPENSGSFLHYFANIKGSGAEYVEIHN